MQDTNDTEYGGGRCKACDKIFEVHEILYRKERKSFEDLCLACRQEIYGDLYREKQNIVREIPVSIPRKRNS